jgi:membrane protein implicated in regulation of membrane protease activity
MNYNRLLRAIKKTITDFVLFFIVSAFCLSGVTILVYGVLHHTLWTVIVLIFLIISIIFCILVEHYYFWEND